MTGTRLPQTACSGRNTQPPASLPEPASGRMITGCREWRGTQSSTPERATFAEVQSRGQRTFRKEPGSERFGLREGAWSPWSHRAPGARKRLGTPCQRRVWLCSDRSSCTKTGPSGCGLLTPSLDSAPITAAKIMTRATTRRMRTVCQVGSHNDLRGLRIVCSRNEAQKCEVSRLPQGIPAGKGQCLPVRSYMSSLTLLALKPHI